METATPTNVTNLKELEYQVFPSTDKTIRVVHDAIYGGAHTYVIQNSLGFNPATQQAETGTNVHVITFVHKPEGDAPMQEGLQSEQLAYVLLDRCQKLNARFPSEHNAKQIAGLEMFIQGCRDRVESRLAAGTMGQLKK
jgi:hypothetical protein